MIPAVQGCPRNTPSGNLTSKGSLTLNYADSNHVHAVTSAGSNTYSYDANGNQTTRVIGADTYDLKYDAENRLVEVKKNNVVIAAFTFDGDGKRVKSVINGTTTLFVGAGFEVRNPGTGQEVTKYYFAGASRVAMRKYVMPQSPTVNYMLYDHLGSTNITTDTNGAVVTGLRYKAWGEVRYPTNGTNPGPSKYTYTGQYSNVDDFGLMFYNARWFDPLTGRFTQPDTIIPQQQGVQAWDRYAYANNNPLYYTDPSGHFAIVPFLIVAAIVVGGWMIAAPPAYAPSSDADLAARVAAAETNPSYQAAEWIDEHPLEYVALVTVAVHTGAEAVGVLAEAADQAVESDPSLDDIFKPQDYPSNEPGKTIDPLTGEEVGRFIGQPDGTTLIEPKGGSTTSSPDGGYVQTHYPDGSDYQRYDGVPNNPHGHGYNQYGDPIDIYGNPVDPKSPDAHWRIPR